LPRTRASATRKPPVSFTCERNSVEMQYTSLNLKRIANTLFAVILFASALSAQSTDQNFPTPLRANEISGVIKARDVGDSRVTTHFYTFEGGQGDLFINVQTANFSGDVDIYIVPGLRPLTKMVMYADAAASETGRVVYLRKPETILLRIEGRTPGDVEATYRIKLAGSFLASRAPDSTPDVPKVNSETQSNVRVNSVGTILEVIPKATPQANETPATEVAERAAKSDRTGEDKAPVETEKKASEPTAETPAPKQEVVVTDPLAETAKAKTPPRRTSRARNNRRAVSPAVEEPAEATVPEAKSEDITPAPPKSARRTSKAKVEKTEAPDPMANVRLVIRFKDGGVIERPMTEVSRFSVERATLTVVSKDGTTGRYSMLDVAGVTIE
jgi:hypothetical protein